VDAAGRLRLWTLSQPTDTLADKIRRAEEGGGAERRERQHREGKLTARERVDFLLDEGTFEELDMLVEHRCLDFGMADQKVPGDGVVSGYGKVDWPARLSSSPRTSPFSAAASPRRTPARSAR
jgi:propionyl-CoA carboxylase beta chain